MKAKKKYMNDDITPPTQGWYLPDIRFGNKFPPRQVLAVGNGFVYFTDTKQHKECELKKWDDWARKVGAVKQRSEQLAS